MARRAAAQEAPWLLFIDTNILLDFYRLQGESRQRQLEALERHQASLILTNQVWMEFLKNRQKVILETLGNVKKPEMVRFPPMVEGYQPAKMVEKNLKQAASQHEKVKAKIQGILSDPSHQDSVYRSLNNIFHGRNPFAIRRDHEDRLKIRSLSRKRFVMGYPPRKDKDNSIGDAINWEWIIHCASKSDQRHNVMIVTRDADYGVKVGDESYINDWLKREFKERVSKKRKIAVTQRLTSALKLLDERVTVQDEREESRVLAEGVRRRQNVEFTPYMYRSFPASEIRRMLDLIEVSKLTMTTYDEASDDQEPPEDN